MAWFEAIDPQLSQTITFEHGTEFALHLLLKRLDIKIFFCRSPQPLAKALSRTRIGRLPRSCLATRDISTIDHDALQLPHIAAYNNTPRKCLDFQTPLESCFIQLLHF